jgi:hypothetical protein
MSDVLYFVIKRYKKQYLKTRNYTIQILRSSSRFGCLSVSLSERAGWAAGRLSTAAADLES